MIKALIFDINGIIIDILTDESRDEIYRIISNLLDYLGVRLSSEEFRDTFWALNRKHHSKNNKQYPEFDVIAIFDGILRKYAAGKPSRLQFWPQALPAGTPNRNPDAPFRQ